MFVLKVVTYSATFLAALVFAFLEGREKQQLTDSVFQPSKMVSEYGASNLSERIKREQILRDLPKEAKSKYQKLVMLRFLFIAALIAEVVIFQR